MKLPSPPVIYNPSAEAQRNRLIETSFQQSYGRGADVVIYPPEKLVVGDIDFLTDQTHTDQLGRAHWNSTEQTLDIGMDYDVVQQVGLETYARVQNVTGSTIANGTVVGFSGVGANNVLQVAPFLADGTDDSLYILGVMTHDLPDTGEKGYCTTWGHVRGINTTGSAVSETWAVGDILYASPTTAGAFTKVKPTAPSDCIPMAAVLKVGTTDGEIMVRPTIEQQKFYGDFARTTSSSAAAANTAYAITFDTTHTALGVSIGSPTSRIVFNNAGLYTVSATFQFTSTNSSIKSAWVWWRINGTDVSQSSFLSSINQNGANLAVSRSEFFSVQAGDYLEVMWAVNDTAMTLNAQAATAFAPSSPAVVLTVDQIQQ